MIANGIETSSEVMSLKDSLSGSGEAKCSRAQFNDSIEGGDGVRRASSEAFGCHDAQRAVLTKELVDGEIRVQRLETEAVVPPSRPAELDA